MQFTKPFKQAIAAGRITTSFRCWRTPQAKPGGQYNIPPYGAIEVTRIRTQPLGRVPAAAIKRAGFADRAELQKFLKADADTSVYQVDFRYLGAGPVKQVATERLAAQELDQVVAKLARMDKTQAWSRTALELIAAHPQTRAGDLAPRCNMDTPTFKRNVRKLKALGLTQSLETGYQLTARGKQVLKKIQ